VLSLFYASLANVGNIAQDCMSLEHLMPGIRMLAVLRAAVVACTAFSLMLGSSLVVSAQSDKETAERATSRFFSEFDTSDLSAVYGRISPEAARLGTSLIRIADDAPTNFVNIRAPGCWGAGDTRYCPSTVNVAGAQRTEVSVERNGSATVEIDLCEKVQKSEAQAIYERFVQNLKALFPPDKFREKMSKRSGLPYLELQFADRADLSLNMRVSNDKYSVSMTITPVN
jgi:hypothetical protein